MGTEHVGSLPDELETWLDDRAADTGFTREELVYRLLDAHRTLDETDEEVRDPKAELRELGDRLAALEDDLDEKITDVRSRVIQVKRETDEKAPESHDHPEIEQQVEAGFENYESVLEYLVEATDAHDAKLDRLGSALVEQRSRVATIEQYVETQEALATLQQEANRHGVATAACGSCGDPVQIGLLTEPSCPHCNATFEGVEPRRYFFGTHRLTVGDPPALEAAEDAEREANASEQAEREPNAADKEESHS